ncbi:channel protein TolC [Rugosibacter aromaticivorans]|uniref:Channel protein TolC n=1 Tax=Rugosibacter aromaticivorans TaxID=1565605 RepID=A0A0C5JBE7_9PROT|nr:TolC family outer membrane protein [Rugosibacter aromaticivorans]AJP49118.1 channel protein TolC [Rugosibacter aromaticivorans]TBR16464.1 MAG: channel protein TolC [Rugosibacter sp.]
MKKIHSLWLISYLFTGGAGAADLLSAYHDAVAYDAQFAAARAALDAGREKLPQGRAGLLPSIGLTANTAWNDDHRTPRATGTENTLQYNSNGWTANLSQPLFRWQNWVAYNQAELAVSLAEAQFAQARQDLILRVAQAYFDVLLAQDALATVQTQKTAIAEQLESAKRSFEVGTTTITDTNEAQSRYDLIIAQEIAAQNDLAVKQETLRTVIGKETGTLQNLRPGAALISPQPNDINAWVTMAETANPGVHTAQAAFEIATREIEKQRAGHYPTLDLVASRNRSALGNSPIFGGSDSHSNSIGLQLSIPVFSGGAIASKDREAVALKEKAAADLENARRQAALEARQSYLGVNAGLSQVKAFEAALVSSQSSLDSNKLGYDVGVRINIDVLNAQSQLYATQQSLSKARLDTLLALLRLKSAAGNLTEQDVQAINALLH